MGREGLATVFQASSFCLRAICRRSHFQSRAEGGPRHGQHKLLLKFVVAREVVNPSLSAPVRAVPWAEEAEQQLSRLALSGCELSVDVCIFRAGLAEAPVNDTQS